MRDDASVLAAGLVFPEDPRWRNDRLYFSDIHGGMVRSMTLDGALTILAELPHHPSGLGWSAGGDLLIVSMMDRRLMRLHEGRLEPYADLSGLAEGPCNDMITDAQGNAYVGDIGYEYHGVVQPKNGRLIRVDTSGKATAAAEDMVCPNGIRFTPDGRTLIVAESFANRLTAFRVTDSGALVERRVFAELGNCVPDGICLDAEGAVWVADAASSSVFRVFEGGRIAQTIHTGALKAFACELGGPDGRHLFICAAPQTGAKNRELRQGAIMLAMIDVPSADCVSSSA